MEEITAKRRKLSHHHGSSTPALDSAVLSASSSSRQNAFALESEELLQQERLDYDHEFEGAEEAMRDYKAILEGVESHGPIPLVEAASKLESQWGIRIPFPAPRPPADSNHKVSFSAPAMYNVVGSFVSRTMATSHRERGLDMIVVMPAEILQGKDYLDMRYFHKRAYYLAVLAAALGKREEARAKMDFAFDCLNENPLLPILSLTPKPCEAKDARRQPLYQIRIIPAAPENFFPPQKLQPNGCLLRKSSGEEGGDGSQPPTPFYNTTLIAECLFLPYLRLLRQTEKKCAEFRSACVLGRIWLRQRAFGGSVSRGGFGNFEWAVLLALLIQGGDKKAGHGPLPPSLRSTQLFKAAIQFLSTTNFAQKPCFLGLGRPSVEMSVEHGPVLYDVARHLNVAFKMTCSSAAMLHQHAKWTRAVLNDAAADQFSPCFIVKADLPFQNFDLVAKLNVETVGKPQAVDGRRELVELSERIHKLLKQAMGDRARLISIRLPPYSSWTLADEPPENAPSRLEVGVLFDAVNMGRTVDRGPYAENKEDAKQFRKFWGEKSDLRRFPDGDIKETLIWSPGSPFEICEQIMRHVFRQHMRLGHLDGEVTFHGGRFPSLVPLKPADGAVFGSAKKAFETFERDVRDLELPLQVRQLAPVCSSLRQASIKLPTLGSRGKAPQPMEVVVSFEASGKWPENLAAIQRTKLAFLLMVGELLEKSKPDEISTRLGLEDTPNENENLGFLDVIYSSSGASIRLRVHSDLEETLLERRVKDKTLEQHVRTTTSATLAAFRRLYKQLPLHTQTISIFATRFPALSPTIRLLKRWFDAHKLLAGHFTEEFVELVALHVFLVPYPWDSPSSPTTGLLRSLLFLARWDWQTEPLIIDTNGELTAADRATSEIRLEAWRKIDPGMNHTVIFLSTAYDAGGTVHTVIDGEPRPSKVVAGRMTALARSACRLVKDSGVELDARWLFTPSLREFDILIHLNRKVLKNLLRTYATDQVDGGNGGNGEDDRLTAVEVKKSRFKNLDERTGQAPLPIVRHPACVLVERLRACYGTALVFFLASAADDGIVGAAWNPQMQKRSFRAKLLASYRPAAGAGAGSGARKGGKAQDGESDEGDGQSHQSTEEDEGEDEDEEALVEVNKEGILAEMARVGGDLIEKVEVQK